MLPSRPLHDVEEHVLERRLDASTPHVEPGAASARRARRPSAWPRAQHGVHGRAEELVFSTSGIGVERAHQRHRLGLRISMIGRSRTPPSARGGAERRQPAGAG
jgi:hypothetical protein